MEDHINVAIRVRPLNQRETRGSAAAGAAASSVLPWHVNRDTITQRHFSEGRLVQGNSFTFDKVFDQKDSTQKVYDDIVKRIITSSMGGFNGTIFAYGQTSSGKTHTMHGNESEPGIIKLAVKNMFSIVENDKTREYLIRVSFLEIYNEVLRDLLEPSKTNLKIHENAKREIFVGDLSEHIVFNATQVEEILAKGDRNRHIAGTNMNERSSRSHTIFRIVIESREKAEASSGVANESESASLAKRQQRLSTGSFADSGEFTGAVMVSCLNLVDLAGSERVGQTGAEGQRLKEGAHINRSLLSLGTVIARLSEDGGDRGHIPYRDSKITRILQPSLGGNAKTLIICTITPAPDYVDEAVSTLKFASRAKTIQNKPEVNEELRGDALLRRLKRASELEKEVAQMKEIEKKKIKIEADNESLLRQLWKSQKERERLQKELEMQQSSMFVPRQIEGRDTDDIGNSVRRQTWFPGLHLPLAEGPATASSSTTPSPAEDGASGHADIDDELGSCQVNGGSCESAGVSNRLHQLAIDQINDLELKNESLLQQRGELTKSNQEMDAAIQRLMRDYTLLLSTLNHLAAAEAIPPSPAKSESSATPRELVQIRRKLRALMTTIDASQKQCMKLRSQRPEAEFLELELQAVRETLVQKEEELVDVMRESDEMFAKYREAEDELSTLQQASQGLRDQIAALAEARDMALWASDTVRAQADQNKQTFESELQNRMADAAQQIEQADSRYQAEIGALESRIGKQSQHIESLTAQHDEREKGYVSQLESVQSVVDGCQNRIKELSHELAEARAHIAAIGSERNSLANAQADAQADAQQKQAEIDRLSAGLEKAMSKANRLEGTVQEKLVKEKEQAAAIRTLTESVDGHRNTIASMESSHSAQISDYERQLDSSQAVHAQEKLLLDEKLREQVSKAGILCAEIKSLSDRVEIGEKEKSQLSSALARVNEQAGAITGLQEEAARLQAELLSLESTRDELAKSLDSKQRELECITEDNVRAHTKIEELETQNADVWERVSELTVSNNDLSSKLAMSEEAFAEKREYAASLEQKVNAVTGDLDSLQTHMGQLVKSHGSALNERDSKEKQLRDALKSKAADAESASQRIEQLQAESSELVESNRQLAAEIGRLEQQMLNLELDVADGKALSESLKTDLAESEKRLLASACESQRLTQSLAAQEADLSAAMAELEESRQAHTQTCSSIDSLTEELKDIRTKLSKTAASLQIAEQELASLQSEHRALQSELENTQRQYAADRAGWEDSLSAKDTALEQSVQALESALADHRQQATELQGRERDAVERASHLEDSLSSTRSQLASLEADMAETDQSKSAIALLNAELTKKLGSVAVSLKQMQARASEQEAELAQKTQQLSDLQTEHQAAAAEWEKEREEKTTQLTGLQAAADQACLDLENARNSHEEAAESLKAQVGSGADKIAHLQQNLVDSGNSIASLHGQLESAEMARDKQQQISAKLQSEIDAVTEELASSRQAHWAETAELQGALNELKTQVQQKQESAQREARDAEETRLALESQLAALQQDFNGASARLAGAERAKGLLSSDLQRHQSLVEKLTASVGDSEQRVKDIQESHADLLASLKSQLHEAVAERDRLSQALSDTQAQLSFTSAEAQDSLSALTICQAELEALKTGNSALADEHSQTCAKLNTLKSELESRASSHADVESRLAQSQAAIEAKTAELKSAQERVDELQQSIEVLKMDLKSASSDHSSFAAEIKEVLANADREMAKLQKSLDDAENMREGLQAQVDDLTKQKEDAGGLLAASDEAKSRLDSEVKISHERLSALETRLSEQSATLASACEEAASIRTECESAQLEADDRIGSLEAEVEGLYDQLLVKSTEADIAAKKLDAALTDTHKISAERASLTSERDRLQVDYDALAERAKSAQARLEQTLSETREEVTSKDIMIQGLEAELDKANVAIASAQSEAQEVAQTEAKGFRAKISALEERAASLNSTIDSLRKELGEQAHSRVSAEDDHASLVLAKSAVDSLTRERDQALSGIDTLKAMMTELAQVKNSEIAELEADLTKHQAMLETSLKESMEKDEAVEQAKKAVAEQTSRANRLQSESAEALAQAEKRAGQLTTIRDDLQHKLDAALEAAAEKSALRLAGEAEVERLREEISERERAEKELQKKLDGVSAKLAEALDSAKNAESDLDASTALADLVAIADGLALLPTCKDVAPTLDRDTSSRSGLLESIHALLLAARSAVSDAATSADHANTEQEIERLQALNAKLEKKNAKLREVYKADMTELHAEEEKQRLQAASLAKELAASTKHVKHVEEELGRAKRALSEQQKQRTELETKLSLHAANARQPSAPGTPVATLGPASRPSTPNSTISATGHSKASMVRLASERTPMKAGVKRVHVSGNGAKDGAGAIPLSPVPPNRLNTRFAHNGDAASAKLGALAQQHPTRKRTAVSGLASTADAAAAATTDTARVRSSYGDRRRIRRNQAEPRKDTLEEQAAEQCVQQ